MGNARGAALASARAGSGNSLNGIRQLLDQGLFKREYRDHGLEWMIRNGGLDIVAARIEKVNVRFVGEFGEWGGRNLTSGWEERSCRPGTINRSSNWTGETVKGLAR